MSLSVSSLVKYLKVKLDSDNKLQGIEVIGELSNFHNHSSGHLYFTLKDESAQIACVMFASKAINVNFKPKNGDKVIVKANTSLFETSGQLQLYVNTLKLAGIGDLYQQYEELKIKLTNEGYFEQDHKLVKPTLYPNKVAVLVGDNSAAMSDIKICFNRRWPLATVDYYPVLVQGSDAPSNIINNLLKVDQMNYEFIILARGGGSFEDLFCFNNEELVKTIYNLKTFLISGIGHEQDFTLTDFVSDLRAATPTAAVELITPNYHELINDIENYKSILTKSIFNIYNNKSMQLDYYQTIINSYTNRIVIIENKINNYLENLNKIMNQIIVNYKVKIEHNKKLLDALSINNTLARGYSLVYKNNKIINSKSELNDKDNITIRLSDGVVDATIKG